MKYKNTYPAELIKLMEEGMFDFQVCAIWGISRTTFYSWLNTKPKLKEAYEIGLPKVQNKYFSQMQKQALEGNDKGFKSMSFILSNKCPDIVKPVEEAKTTNVTVHNMNVIQKTPQELIESVKANLDFLKDNKIIDVEVKTLDDRSDEQN